MIPTVRYIEVPDCPALPTHPAWWIPVIWGSVIVGVAFCIMLAVTFYNRYEYKRTTRLREIDAQPDLNLDKRLKKVESYVGGGGP